MAAFFTMYGLQRLVQGPRPKDENEWGVFLENSECCLLLLSSDVNSAFGFPGRVSEGGQNLR